MKAELFFQKWNGEKTRYDYNSMKIFGLPEEYCHALSVFGLPKYIEPGMNFERDSEEVIRSVERKEYYYLGFQVNGRYICLRKKDFAIILVSMDDFYVGEEDEYVDEEIHEAVLNSSLEGLYGCLYCYYDFKQNCKNYTEEEYDNKYDAMFQQIEIEDSNLPQYGFWEEEFEVIDAYDEEIDDSEEVAEEEPALGIIGKIKGLFRR